MNRRRGLLVVALDVLAGAYLLAGGVGLSTEDPPAQEIDSVDDAELIQPTENGSYLWPYTSRSRSVEHRTLAINLIIHAPPDEARTALIERSDLDWEETNETMEDAGTDTYEISVDDGVDWDDADGSTRYSYIDRSPHGGEGEWVDESYQLHSGAYLGSRHHIRAYSSEDDNWTAIQVHHEYFDWFRLRHTVTDIDNARVIIEDDFIEQPFVTSVSRNYYGLDGGWSDGWISEIELATALLLLTFVSHRTRRTTITMGRDLTQWASKNRYGFVLAASLAALLLGVRFAGIALEATVTSQSPQILAGVLYPLLVFGPPILVAVLAPRLDALPAFGFTLAGMGVGFVYDFAAIGLGVVPIELVLHRLGLVIALGAFAAAIVGSHNREPDKWEVADADPPLTLLTIAAWFLGLALPLFGYI